MEGQDHRDRHAAPGQTDHGGRQDRRPQKKRLDHDDAGGHQEDAGDTQQDAHDEVAARDRRVRLAPADQKNRQDDQGNPGQLQGVHPLVQEQERQADDEGTVGAVDDGQQLRAEPVQGGQDEGVGNRNADDAAGQEDRIVAKG